MKYHFKSFFVAVVVSSLFVSAEVSALTTTQISAIISLMQSFGVSTSVVQSVSDALSGELIQVAPGSLLTEISPITILSPNGGETLIAGQPMSLSWKGGTGKVQLGIVNAQFTTDGTVLGWIALKEKPSGSVLWDGASVWDLSGSVSQLVAALPPGPYKIVAISEGQDKQFCAMEQKGCNYDASDSYLSIMLPSTAKALVASCTASVSETEVGTVVTWSAEVSKGKAPYIFTWNGTDGIGSLKTRTDKPQFVDVLYSGPGIKTAGVKVSDASGEEYTTACKWPITINKNSSVFDLLSPAGGERFFMSQGNDLSQAIKVSWQFPGLKPFRKDFKVALIDEFGRSCLVGSASSTASQAFAPVALGFPCDGGWSLSPGEYRVRVYREGSESTISDISAPITLVAPAGDSQSITASVSSITSPNPVTFTFVAPVNTFKSALFLHCPEGVSAVSPPNACNRYNEVTAQVLAGTGFSVTFANTTGKVQSVSANFYVYLPNNPDFGRGVQTIVTVLPPSSAQNTVISVVAPNGGESIKYGTSYTYRFSTTQNGTVDLSLVPSSSPDSGLICKLVTALTVESATPSGQFAFTIPSDGTCVNGPAKIVSGVYRLVAILRSGSVTIGSDISDATFTITSSATSSQ